MKKVMLTVGENEKITDATSKLLSSVAHGTYDSKFKRNQRDTSLTFLVMCFSKGVSYALY